MRVGVLGNKGGTGKTAIAVHLAFAISEKKQVLFIDTDYAQNSGMRWIFGRDKNYEYMKFYENNNIVGIRLDEKLSFDKIKDLNKFEHIIVDGRPEPNVTVEALYFVNGGVVILPISVEADSILQAQELYDAIKEEKLNVRQYAIVNKMSQSRVSQFLYSEIEKRGFDIMSTLSFIEYMKWSEKDCIPLWKIRGSGRVKHSDVFKEIANWIIQGRL